MVKGRRLKQVKKEKEEVHSPTSGKVILLDWGVFLFKAIFIWRNNRTIPASYTALRMMLSCLRDVGVNENDIVIVAVDGSKSWRKDLDANYKANRKELREQATDIDWSAKFEESNQLIQNIREATPFYAIQIPRLEADDIIAVGVRYFHDRPCVIISSDQDYEQLTAYDYVKVFSDRSHQYKIIKNPYGVLAKKIRKEVSDNLHEEIKTEKEYEIREQIVSLLRLPDDIEALARKEFDLIAGAKIYDASLLRFNSLKGSLTTLINSTPRVTFEASEKRLERKEKRNKKKRQKKLNNGEAVE